MENEAKVEIRGSRYGGSFWEVSKNGIEISGSSSSKEAAEDEVRAVLALSDERFLEKAIAGEQASVKSFIELAQRHVEKLAVLCALRK